ncbi:MAG: hypothetical protein WBF87_01165 [Mesorhizobium sp.]
MSLPRFHFVQERGPWIAHCADPRCVELLGTDTVPVLRDFKDGQWTWGKAGISLNANPDQFVRPWWNDAGQERWRELLLAGQPVLLRRATQPTPDAPTGSVGDPVGVFRATNVRIEPEAMSLELVERLANAF